MKNVLIALLLLLISTASYSQTIAFDKAEQDGSRKVGSTELFVRNGFTDKSPFYYRIITISRQKTVQYFLDIHINGDVPYSLKEGSLLLIKTSTNKILESKNIIPEYKTFDIPHNNIYGRYPFNESEITEIIKGIVKIRIEAPLKTIDIEYSSKKTKQISKGLTERYNDIKKSLFIKKDIRSNF